MLGMTISAPLLFSASSGKGPVLTATVKHFAATAACTPKGAFSTTIVSQGLVPTFLIPAR